ncbi:proline-rich transmembrane protein 4-like [Anguilla anguilla]|uniref:proline-rich transmembrane protein 4-like n=1 Tax=Anguilla anguilla TaxID=7936 RepID=UPI0015AEF28B|nr:proline-rich transmembrane protein 4-like [Anguilla anguilla]XP_035281650.1 proline-rich transmembrane protein 4-like [Anguilla anguilla]
MCGHSWVLLLGLWQVQFSSCLATPPTGGQPARTPPWARPAAEPSVLRRSSDASDLWPFWVSVDVPSEPEGSSPLSLPVSLTSDLQGLPHAGNTQSLRPAIPPFLTDSTSKSTALLPKPGTRLSLGKESTSISGDTAPWLWDTELPTDSTSDFADLSPAQGQVPHLMPQPTHSLKGEGTVSQTPMGLTPELAPSAATPNRSTPPTGTPERKVPALPLPPESAAPDPQAGGQGPVAGPAGGRPTRKGARTRKRMPQTGGGSTEDGEAKATAPDDGGAPEGEEQKPTQTLTAAAESPGYVAPGGDWPSEPGDPDSAHVPHCNGDSGACKPNSTWSPALSEDIAYNQSHGPSPPPAPPPAPPLLLVPLHADWNNAMATWGVAWEVHVFGVGSLFVVAALLSALDLLLLPLLRPPGGSYLALAHLFLLAASSSRAFSLFYDAYAHLDKLPAANFLLLHQVPFPCLTGAFAAAFLFLSLRSRVRLPGSPCHRPCSLAVLLLLHFGATFSSLLVLQAFPQWPWLLLISQGVFVVLIAFLSVTYLIFCCYTRADAKHVYHLSNTLPIRRGWDRAAVMAGFSALFMLACAGLQLYAMLHALALAPPTAPPHALEPWPWWAFQLSCRLCEVGVCITLASAATPPLRRSLRPCRCWATNFCCRGCCGNASTKQAVPPMASEWELRQQEKLAICEGVGSELLPLYALVDPNLSSLEGLDLLYHGGGVLSRSVSNTDTPLKVIGGSRGSSYASLQLDSDSTGDLRPPSPINLRRSIDEALFSPALFPHSLFSPAPRHAPRRGSASLTPPAAESSGDQALYRTASCLAIEAGPPLIGSSLSGPTPVEAGLIQWAEHRRGSSSSSSLGRHSLDGSSVVLCPSREACGHCQDIQSSSDQGTQFHRCYLGLASASQENLDQRAETDLAVQEEFIRVCRQIDALSISSDTIDL